MRGTISSKKSPPQKKTTKNKLACPHPLCTNPPSHAQHFPPVDNPTAHTPITTTTQQPPQHPATIQNTTKKGTTTRIAASSGGGTATSTSFWTIGWWRGVMWWEGVWSGWYEVGVGWISGGGGGGGGVWCGNFDIVLDRLPRFSSSMLRPCAPLSTKIKNGGAPC